MTIANKLGIILLIASMMMVFTGSVEAASNNSNQGNNGVPDEVAALEIEVASLREQLAAIEVLIANIETTPGEPGPQGVQGPQGDDGFNGFGGYVGAGKGSGLGSGGTIDLTPSIWTKHTII